MSSGSNTLGTLQKFSPCSRAKERFEMALSFPGANVSKGISLGRNLWINAQRASPSEKLVFKSVMATPAYPAVLLLNQSLRASRTSPPAESESSSSSFTNLMIIENSKPKTALSFLSARSSAEHRFRST